MVDPLTKLFLSGNRNSDEVLFKNNDNLARYFIQSKKFPHCKLIVQEESSRIKGLYLVTFQGDLKLYGTMEKITKSLWSSIAGWPCDISINAIIKRFILNIGFYLHIILYIWIFPCYLLFYSIFDKNAYR